ncbi:MAG: 2OG-Fe(II) oxygenase [Candidatus Competibacteraceae bacterium]
MSILNLAALAATPLQHDPFDFLIVPAFIETEALARINQDFPPLHKPGNFPLEALHYGPGFQSLLDELQGPEFTHQIAAKFSVDLTACPTMITVRGFCEPGDGNIHTDSKTKIITVLVYLNTGWSHEGGKLRLLRSATDLEDYAAEVPPVSGTLLAFRRSDNSFHGHKPFTGERRIVQLSWVKPKRVSNYTQKDRSLAKRIKRWFKAA